MKRSLLALLLVLSPLLAQAEPLSDLDLETLKPNQGGNESVGELPKNPFVPGIQTLNDISLQDLVLSGIIYSESQSWAMINGQMIQKGEKLAGYEVSDIQSNSIFLKQGDLTYELKLSGF